MPVVIVGIPTGTCPIDLNFPVFAMGVRIFRASNDVGPLFLVPGSTRILERNGPLSYIVTSPENTYPRGKHGEIKVHRSNVYAFNNISVILWPSVLLLEETEGNHRPVAT